MLLRMLLNQLKRVMSKIYFCINVFSDLTGCAVVTISANPKIFSNGMDLVNITDENDIISN